MILAHITEKIKAHLTLLIIYNLIAAFTEVFFITQHTF